MSVPSDDSRPAVRKISVTSSDGHTTPAAIREQRDPGPHPALIFIHGGLKSWSADRLSEAHAKFSTLDRFHTAGYVTVCATFRDQPNPQAAHALRDCVAAVERIANWPTVNPRSVAVYGCSAGGSLALELAGEVSLAAISIEEPAVCILAGMCNGDRERCKEIVKDHAPYYTPELQAATRAKVRKIGCPVYLAHGDRCPANKLIYEILIPELEAAGKTFSLKVYANAAHGSSMKNPVFFADSDAFFRKHLATEPSPGEPFCVQEVHALPGSREP